MYFNLSRRGSQMAKAPRRRTYAPVCIDSKTHHRLMPQVMAELKMPKKLCFVMQMKRCDISMQCKYVKTQLYFDYE